MGGGSSDGDSSSSEEVVKKKKKKKKGGGGGEKKKKTIIQKTGGGEAVSVYKGPPPEEIMDTVKGAAIDLIGTDELDGDMPLMEAGLDSLAAVEYGSILQKAFAGITLPATLMFDFPTTNMIAELVTNDLKEKLTVTEVQGGEMIEIEVEVSDDEGGDSDGDSSSSEEVVKKKKK